MKRRYLPFLLLVMLLLPAGGDVVLASVGITGFQARAVAGGIELSWITGFEDNNLGFNLWRAAVDDPYSAVVVNDGLIPTASSGGSGAAYSYLDADVTAGVTYYYWLQDVDGSDPEEDPGQFEGPVSASFGGDGGLATPTPTGGAGGDPTATPDGAGPTPPGAASPTPQPSPDSPSPTATTRVAGGGAPPTVTLSPTRSAPTAAPPSATPAPLSSPPASPTPSATRDIGRSDNPTATPTLMPTATEPAAADPPAVADAQLPGGGPAETGAATIGQDTGSGTVLAGEAARQGVSPLTLMLLISGAVFLLGGGGTALYLLRKTNGGPP